MPLKPLECSQSNCLSVVTVIKWCRIYHVCGECALIISSLISCPLKDPYPDPVKKKVHHKQSKESMKREIKKAEIRRDARSFQSYSSNINDLLKRYKK